MKVNITHPVPLNLIYHDYLISYKSVSFIQVITVTIKNRFKIITKEFLLSNVLQFK